MENFFRQALENSKQAITNWWLLMALGILSMIVGLLIFLFPQISYTGMALAFGLVIMSSGIALIIVSMTNNHYITSRGWMFAGGLIELLLGAVLTFNPAFAAGVLPYFLGFWLLFRSFGLLGLGGDMRAVRLRGATRVIILGVLVMVCSLFILFQPSGYGISAVVLWVGLSFLFAGASMMAFSWQLKNVHLAIS